MDLTGPGGNGSGIWHQDDAAWGNNGIIPDGYNYFFTQIAFGTATGILSQVVGGFAPQRRYFLHYDVNMRDFPDFAPLLWPYYSPKASVIVTLGGVEIDRFENFQAVETNHHHTVPWHHRVSIPINAQDDGTKELKFLFYVTVPSVAVEGSPLLDHVHFVQDPPDLNTPPIIQPVEDQQLSPGSRLEVHIAASDTNEPTQNLKFAVSPPVDGAEVNDLGDFIFTALRDAAETNIPITVIVWDDGNPPKTNSVSFTISVVADRLKLESVTGDVAALSWPSVSGERYRVQGTENLEAPDWKDLTEDIPGESSRTRVEVLGNEMLKRRFFRLRKVM
jgi:hypothetical protein